jgi:phage tail-like protein
MFVRRSGVVLGMMMAVALLPLSASAQPLPLPVQPVRFSLQVDGASIATFDELVAITTEVEPVELVQNPADPSPLKKLPGKRKPPTLTLKRGKAQDTTLWAWHEQVLAGNVLQARHNASLVMFATDGTPVARYHLENAWPTKLEIGALRAGSTDQLVETVTIQAERIKLVAP